MTPNPTRARLRREDLDAIVQVLTAKGLKVHTRKGTRIDVYKPDNREYICGFTWHKGTKTSPSRWTFDIALADIFSQRDLRSALTELQRVQDLRTQAEVAWSEYLESKSEKRWSAYLSFIAAIFTRAPRRRLEHARP